MAAYDVVWIVSVLLVMGCVLISSTNADIYRCEASYGRCKNVEFDILLKEAQISPARKGWAEYCHEELRKQCRAKIESLTAPFWDEAAKSRMHSLLEFYEQAEADDANHEDGHETEEHKREEYARKAIVELLKSELGSDLGDISFTLESVGYAVEALDDLYKLYNRILKDGEEGPEPSGDILYAKWRKLEKIIKYWNFIDASKVSELKEYLATLQMIL